jgi:hypothetical protein
LDQVREQLAEGSLQSDDLAIHEGIEDPVPLSELMASVESAPSQEPVKDEGKAKPALKKMGLLKKIIYGALIAFTVFVYVIRFGPKPQVDIGELETFVSKQLSDSLPGTVINSVELEITKEDKDWDTGRIYYAGSIEVSKSDGSKRKIAGTVIARYWGIFGRNNTEWEDEYGPRMGRFYIKYDFTTSLRIEAETRKALRHKLDLNSQTKGAVIGSLSLQKREWNKYTGTVEITDPDGSKIKLDLHVTDHDGKIFFETKDPQ